MPSRNTRKARTQSGTRKAPRIHAADMEIGRVYEHNNQFWIVAAAGKSRRWIKATGYFTHDNGARPFYATVKDGGITVLKGKCDSACDSDIFMLPVYSHAYSIPKYQKLWIGSNSGKFENPLVDEYPGNSLFVHVANNKYVYIGESIIELTINDTIKEYHSIIGASDVVYPFAVGEKNIYFPSEALSIPIETFKPDQIIDTFFKNKKKASKIPVRIIVSRLSR